MKKKSGACLFAILLAMFLIFPALHAQSYLEEVRACGCLAEGKIDEALRLLNTKLKRYPGNLDCHLYLGLAYYLQGDFEKAKKSLNKVEFETEKMEGSSAAVTADQTYANVDQIAARRGVVFTKGRRGILKFSLGILYKKDKDYKEAHKKFKDALKYKYPEVQAREQMLMVNAFSKDYKKGRDELKKLKEAGEESEALSFLEGYLSFYLKKEEDAIKIFSELAENMLLAKKNLAVIHYNQENYEKANEIWLAILEDSPKDVSSLRDSGRAYHHLGKNEEAQAQFEKAGLKMKPEKYSPKKIALILVDFFEKPTFDFQCNAQNR